MAKGKKDAKKNALEAACVPQGGREERSVSVREIDNGFIVSQHSYGPKGYKSTETFHKTKPKIVTKVEGGA